MLSQVQNLNTCMNDKPIVVLSGTCCKGRKKLFDKS